MKTFPIAAVGLSLIASVLAGGSGNYQQCGGVGFSGSTSCADGWKCLCQNKCGYLIPPRNTYHTHNISTQIDYSQCLPPNQPAPNGWNQAGCPSSSGGSTPQPPASSPPPTSNPPATNSGSTGSSGTCSAYSGSKSGYATTTVRPPLLPSLFFPLSSSLLSPTISPSSLTLTNTPPSTTTTATKAPAAAAPTPVHSPGNPARAQSGPQPAAPPCLTTVALLSGVAVAAAAATSLRMLVL